MLAGIRSLEAGDIDTFLRFLAWRQFPCTGEGEQGIAPSCRELAVPSGTNVEMFQYLLLSGSYFTRSQFTVNLQELLRNNNATLALVAEQADGTLRVSFTLTPIPGSDLRGIDFIVNPSSPAPFVGYIERMLGSTPLDRIREASNVNGEQLAETWYVSPAMLDWEAEKDAAQRNPSPG